MQDALYEFLILNRKLSLPGVGTICLKQNAAKLDFGNKQFAPQSYFFVLETDRDQPSKKMFEWLSTSRNISEWDAVKAINEFSFSLKDKIASAGTMSWDNVGIFSRDEKGSFMLESSPLSFETPVAAEKVIREKAEHTVMVGVEEKTVAEMEEYFAEDTTKRDYGWVIAVILAVISVMFVGWYFSQNGFLPSSAGNKTFIKSN